MIHPQGIRTMPHTPRRVYIYEQEQSKSRAITQTCPEATGSRTPHKNEEGIECTLHMTGRTYRSLSTPHMSEAMPRVPRTATQRHNSKLYWIYHRCRRARVARGQAERVWGSPGSARTFHCITETTAHYMQVCIRKSRRIELVGLRV